VKASERHRLKHDAYADTVYASLHWIREHLAHVVVGAVAVLAVTATIIWMAMESRRKTAEAWENLAEIQNEARTVPALDAEARRQTVLRIVGRCEEIAAVYPGSDAAPSALFLAGQMLASIKEPAAEDYFARVLDMRSAPPGLKELAARSLAGALESAGKYAEAIAEYEKMLAGASDEARDQARWDIARCRDLMGDADLARQDYEALATGNRDNRWSQLARARLLFLDNPPSPFASIAAARFRNASPDSLFGIPLNVSDLVAVPDKRL